MYLISMQIELDDKIIYKRKKYVFPSFQFSPNSNLRERIKYFSVLELFSIEFFISLMQTTDFCRIQ